MAQYSNSEILNELSQVFRGRIDPVRDAGLVNPQEVHAQILEIAAMVFLSDKGAIYYLAKIVRNTLSFLAAQEIAILEDMLIAIENLQFSRNVDGGPIGNIGPTDLANADTQLLALDAASTVQNRPELSRFGAAVDKFVGHLSDAVTSAGSLALPRGEARAILKRDIILLKEIHPRLLKQMLRLENTLSNYISADVPTHVSTNAIANVRALLQEMSDLVASGTAESNLAQARLLLLRSLVLKVAIGLLQKFQNPDPAAPKLTSTGGGTAIAGVVGGSPNDAPKGPFTLRAAGAGTPAHIVTVSGPWLLDDLSTHTLRFKIDGGAEQVFDLTQITGPGLNGRNAAPFLDSQLYPVWPGPPPNPSDPPPPDKDKFQPKSNLFINLDPDAHDFDAEDWFPGTEYDFLEDPNDPFTRNTRKLYNQVQMQPPRKLGFKHLGCPIFFSFGKDFDLWRIDRGLLGGGSQTQVEDIDNWDDPRGNGWPNLFKPRVVTELYALHTNITLTFLDTNRYSVSPAIAQDWYVGFYVRMPSLDSNGLNNRYEITKVISSGELIIDTRGAFHGAEGVADLMGEPNNRTIIEFSPDIMAGTKDMEIPENFPRHAFVKIAPAVKTAKITGGNGANISLVIGCLSDPNTALFTDAVDQPYSHPAYFCSFREVIGAPGKLAVINRSRFEPQKMKIEDKFLSVRKTANSTAGLEPPFDFTKIENSAHEVLGFKVGQKVDDKLDVYLDPKELEGLIKSTMDQTTTVVSAFETDIITRTAALRTVAGTTSVVDPDINFQTLDIGFGYFLEIKGGDAKGTYIIESNLANTLFLQRLDTFIGNETELDYRIFIQQLLIASKNDGRGSSVEILQAPTQFGYPAGIQYGTTNQVEAVNANGDNLNLSGLGPEDKSGDICILSVSADGKTATTCDPVSTGLSSDSFAFLGNVEKSYRDMQNRLNALLTSRNLLGKNNFNVSVDAIDAAITPLVTPGIALQSNFNQARATVASLLSTLTVSPRRSTEYPSTKLPTAALNLEDSVAAYDAPRVTAIDSLLDTLFDHRYDRAASLLITGQVKEFFETTSETASFSGALLAASKAVVKDLPLNQNLLSNAADDLNTASSVVEGTDADQDLSDVGL
jgi:hypothetical protein